MDPLDQLLADARQLSLIEKSGTSAGAKKGWANRQGRGASAALERKRATNRVKGSTRAYRDQLWDSLPKIGPRGASTVAPPRKSARYTHDR